LTNYGQRFLTKAEADFDLSLTATRSIIVNNGKTAIHGNSGTVGVGVVEAENGIFGGKVTVCVLLHPLVSPKNTYG